jgi:phage portal protein BeeE
MEWIDGKRYGVSDIARFFGCPGDLIDAAVSTGSITYANMTQRNLQFLIMHLGPAVYRRERASVEAAAVSRGT